MAIHEKLRQARLDKNLKQTEVSKALDCAPTSFSNWEGGRVNPPLEQLEKMCQIYGISPLDLLDEYPTITDIYNISKKPVSQRTYEDEISLSFCGDISDLVGFIDETEHTTLNTDDEEELFRLYRKLKAPEKEFLLRMMRGLVV